MGMTPLDVTRTCNNTQIRNDGGKKASHSGENTTRCHQSLFLTLIHKRRVERNGSIVMNLVYELPLTRHQRSLAHHMDSCTTLTVARHLRLQFPSAIALTTHTADCTDHSYHQSHIELITQLNPIRHAL